MMKKLEWYKFPPVSVNAFYGTIVDWNQTLVTMLNVACNGADKSAKVIAAESARPIIESLFYFNNKTSRIGNRFSVSFSNEFEDLIICECDSDKIEIVLVNDNYPSLNY